MFIFSNIYIYIGYLDVDGIELVAELLNHPLTSVETEVCCVYLYESIYLCRYMYCIELLNHLCTIEELKVFYIFICMYIYV
jgi:hypothetical protein